MSDDAGLVRVYLREIGREPLLSKEDEVRLARAIESGRRASMELARPGEENLTPARRAALEEVVAAGERAWDQLVRANCPALFPVYNTRPPSFRKSRTSSSSCMASRDAFPGPHPANAARRRVRSALAWLWRTALGDRPKAAAIASMLQGSSPSKPDG